LAETGGGVGKDFKFEKVITNTCRKKRVNDITELPAGSGFRKELEYLAKGYKYHLNAEGTVMIK
jgi:hypothetical protein